MQLRAAMREQVLLSKSGLAFCAFIAISTGCHASKPRCPSVLLPAVGPSSDPQPSECWADMRSLGVTWRKSAARKQVLEPVEIDPVINGVTFVGAKATAPSWLYMDCALASRLGKLAAIVGAEGITEVKLLGIHAYRKIRNPRCQARGDCGLSQHSFATAVDIHEFSGPSVRANVEADWVIDKPGEVCSATARKPADALLHKLACAMRDERVFNVILTPNYNELHRNHFHVDLTPGVISIHLPLEGQTSDVHSPVVNVPLYGIDPDITELSDE